MWLGPLGLYFPVTGFQRVIFKGSFFFFSKAPLIGFKRIIFKDATLQLLYWVQEDHVQDLFSEGSTGQPRWQSKLAKSSRSGGQPLRCWPRRVSAI